MVVPGTPVQAFGGWRHSCVLLTSGEVWCWGQNETGALGDGTNDSSTSPVQVDTLVRFTALAVGGTEPDFTCALCPIAMDQGVYCWGSNEMGQLGDGTTRDRARPVRVSGAEGVGESACVGESHTCTVWSSGSVACWGNNMFGQVGEPVDPNDPEVLDPRDVNLPSPARSVACGLWFTCALLETGRVACWGDNRRGQLGPNASAGANPDPADLGLTGVVSLAAGGHFACAVMTGGSLVCWGANDHGELGRGPACDAVQDPEPGPVVEQ